jgi:transposase
VRNELERALIAAVALLVGADCWPSGRPVTDRERQWLVAFLVTAFEPRLP